MTSQLYDQQPHIAVVRQGEFISRVSSWRQTTSFRREGK